MARAPGHRRAAWLALCSAAVFVVVFWGLNQHYPRSIWVEDDYAALALANAVHLDTYGAPAGAHPAPGMAGHPGVPFYFASGLAAALGVAPGPDEPLGRFARLMDEAESFYTATQAIALAIHAAAVALFVFCAAGIVSPAWILVALLAWIAGSPYSIVRVISLSNESFALPLNAALLVLLVRLGGRTRTDWFVAAACGVLGALGYLVKLHYVYVGAALAIALMAKCVSQRRGWLESGAMVAMAASLGVGLAWFACLALLGEVGFTELRRFHWSILTHGGLYGTGPEGLLDTNRLAPVAAAVLQWRDPALPIAGALLVAGAVAAFRLRRRLAAPAWILLSGTCTATLLSAAALVKHYNDAYVVAVAATLPGLVVALGAIFTTSREGVFRPDRSVFRSEGDAFRPWAASLPMAIGLASLVSLAISTRLLEGHSRATVELASDRAALEAILASRPGRTVFCYRARFRERVEGFVAHYSGVPEIERAYATRDRVSSFVSPAGPFANVVIDKDYFRTSAPIVEGRNLEPTNVIALRYAPGDRLVELHRVFVLSRPEDPVRQVHTRQ